MGQTRHRLLPLAVLLACSCMTLARRWTADSFPNPLTDIKRCGRGMRSWICDPDNVLTTDGANVVEGVIKLIAAGEKPYIKAPCGGDGYQGYEVGVAVMDEFKSRGDDDAEVAERFARAVHADWGVGRAACQNGVLVLLALHNRQMYISTGEGTKDKLTYDQLGNIIDEAKPFLRQKRYDDALQHVVVNIGLALAGLEIERTPASSGEGGSMGWGGFLVLMTFFGIFGSAIYFGIKQSLRTANRYRDCRTLLERLKRDQANLQAGAYAVSTCPICLEELSAAPEPEGDGAGTSSGTAAAGSSSESAPLMGGAGPSSSAAGAAASPSSGPAPRRPLVAPCGHVFCEPCIAAWLEQRKTTCPICRRNMDGTEAPPPPQQRPPCQEQQAAWEQDFTNTVLLEALARRSQPTLRLDPLWGTRTRNWRYTQHGPGPWGGYTMNDMRQRGFGGSLTQAQAQELFRQDLMFRLQSLNRRYPEFVTRDMVRTWGQDVYNGRELSAAALRDFQLNDPAVKRELAQHGSSGASNNFGGGGGGGRSSGGRGGSW